MKIVKHILVVALLTILVGCGRQEPSTPAAYAHDHSPVVIARDGQLYFEDKPMTDADLVAMVKERTDYGSHYYTNQTGVPLIDGTILIEPDPETPYGRVREIQRLIMKHGGTPASRFNPEESPTTD